MEFQPITSFETFCLALRKAGFVVGGENAEGIFSLTPYFAGEVRWHTGNMDTDPWEWRIRTVKEGDDIAFGKLFLHKTGYITKEWYPYFLAARRKGHTFTDAYESGTISYMEKRIYECLRKCDAMPFHEIKAALEIDSTEKSKFERALVQLQMNMYVTICGETQKSGRMGQGYGWPVNIFCLPEHFFDQSVFEKAAGISAEYATEKITEQILLLNPLAQSKDIQRFTYTK